MAGVATAYSTDALTSSGGVDNEIWEFAVPISTDVGFLLWTPRPIVRGHKIMREPLWPGSGHRGKFG